MQQQSSLTEPINGAPEPVSSAPALNGAHEPLVNGEAPVGDQASGVSSRRRWWCTAPRVTTTAVEPLLASDATSTKEKETPMGSLSLRKVLALSSQERPVLLLAMLMRIGSEGCSLANPLILAHAYDAVVDSYSHPELDEHTRHVVLRTFTWVLILHATGQVLAFFSGFATGISGERVVARLRRRLYEHLLTQEMGFFDGQKSGDLVSRLGTDTLLVQTATTSSLNEFFIGLIKVVGGVTLMFIVSWEMTLIVFVTIMAWLCLICIPGMRAVRKLTVKYQAALAQAAIVSTEALGMMRTVRSFAAEMLELSKYQGSVGAPRRSKWWPAPGDTTYRHGVYKSICSTALASSGFAVIFGALQVSVAVGFYLITYGDLKFGRLTAFQSYQMQIVMGIGQLAMSAMQLAQAMGGATKIFELLDRQPQLPISGGHVPEEPMRGAISFDQVVFAFPTSPAVTVLRGFSLKVEADTTVALVGSSGCGKSTTLALLLRFYDPLEGSITIDGHSISSLDPAWMRSHMSFVQQEPLLFGVSVRENVAYALAASAARADAAKLNFEDEQLQARVEEACRLANAHDFITNLTDGYATLVGERGVKLSGGQKQRIAIARALLANPRILLLDEATSALDSQSERLVQDAIDAASTGRSVMVVAHRLSTVRDADQIAVISQGVVEDSGPHDDLITRCATYQTLVKRQMNSSGATAPAAAPASE